MKIHSKLYWNVCFLELAAYTVKRFEVFSLSSATRDTQQ